MTNTNEVNKYRQEVIAKFFNTILEIELKTSTQNAIRLENCLEEEVSTKLAHFMDCLLQCSNSTKCTKDSNCGSCCGKCNCE